MTRTLRTALTVVLLVCLIAAGSGTAVADSSTEVYSGGPSVYNGDDFAEAYNSANDISGNGAGVQVSGNTVNGFADKDDDHPDKKIKVRSAGAAVVNDDNVGEGHNVANRISGNGAGVQVSGNQANLFTT